jgi:hypothetical protein
VCARPCVYVCMYVRMCERTCVCVCVCVFGGGRVALPSMQSACAVLHCHLWPLCLHSIFRHYLTCEIKSRIAMAKDEFNKKKKNLFTSKLDLDLR